MPKTPNIPAPVAPPPAPPAPTKTAKVVENKKLTGKKKKGTTGTSALSIRRPSINMSTSGSGANVSY